MLTTLKNIAAREGRQLQTLVGEALREYIERKTGVVPRSHVMDSFRNSTKKFGGLYKKLAK